MESKVCTTCKVEKPLEYYHKEKAGKYGRSSKCKSCKNKSRKEWYANGGKKHVLEYHRKNKVKVQQAVEKYQSKMQPGVYRLWTEEGDYIGESVKMQRRVWNHKEWNKNSPINSPILGWEVLEVVEDEAERKKREIYWIKKLNPTLNQIDYHWGSIY